MWAGLGVDMECGSAFCRCGVVGEMLEVYVEWVFVWSGMEVGHVCAVGV